VVYATEGWSIHDARWFAALQVAGLEPIVMSVTEDPDPLPGGARSFASVDELRFAIDFMAKHSSGDEISSRSLSVLAGPLTTITRRLVGLNARLVGLSWGWDLQPGAIGQPFVFEELSWVSRLDGLIVDSLVTEGVAEGLGLVRHKVHVVPWGIDIELFTPAGPVADLGRWGVEAGKKVILSLRSHTPIHRVGDVIEAFALAVQEEPSLILLVGGDGPLLADNIRRVAGLGIGDHVRFIGLLPEPELPPIMRAVDVYVSATAVDGTSVTLLQALACATPVLVSAIPGNLPWVPKATNLFATGDVIRLAQLLVGQPAREQAGIEALSTAEQVRSVADWHRNSQACARWLLA
jgi:glycosyltransferase involved in cell wall biosynthesis